jgi:hypothetical protein
MEELVYKFLDDYLGDDVFYKIKPINYFIKEPYSVNRCNRYYIYSKKNKSIILFFNHFHNSGNIKIFRDNVLTGTVSRFFDIGTESAQEIIKNWFGDKHNLEKVSDLLSFISEEDLVKQ